MPLVTQKRASNHPWRRALLWGDAQHLDTPSTRGQGAGQWTGHQEERVARTKRIEAGRKPLPGDTGGYAPTTSKAKPPASVLSSDLTVIGNLKTTGDIQVEGTIEGDIRAHLLTVGEGATIRGEIVADDIVAGLYTLAVLHLARWALERLG